MAKKKHTLLELGALAIAGFGGYEYVYKPWAAARAAGATPAKNPLTGIFGNVGGMVTTPIPITGGGGTNQSGTPGTSTPDPRNTVGGPVGYAMWLKGWDQKTASTRIAALQNAAANARQAIQDLQTNVNNPASADLAQAQAVLAANQAALAAAQQAYQQLTAAGNTVGAAQYAAAIAGHQADISDLTARIAATSAPLDNSAAIAAFSAQLAANQADYAALTGGMTL